MTYFSIPAVLSPYRKQPMGSMASVQKGMDLRVCSRGPLSSSLWLEVCKAHSHTHHNYFLEIVNVVQNSGIGFI